MAAIPRYSLLVLPPEVLLLLRPHLCIASWTHLAQCSVALRQIFCVEEDLKKACFARGIAVPLRRAAWQPPRAASERPCFPNHRILCAKLAQHLRLCGLMACHDVCARSAGDALKDDAETGQTEALADTHELITLSKALKLEPKDRPIWSPIVQSLPIISYDSVKAAGIFTEEDDYLPGYRGANSSDVEPLFKHLPIMALHATTPPVERMTFYGSRSPWAATISNSGGCTVSDSVVLLVKGKVFLSVRSLPLILACSDRGHNAKLRS